MSYGFIADRIHHQLIKLPTKGVFRYSSYLFHLFMFFQADNFPISLQKMDLEGQPLSIIFWTSLLRKEDNEFNYTDFLDLFLQPTMNILYKFCIHFLYLKKNAAYWFKKSVLYGTCFGFYDMDDLHIA